jgi:hypothetical protein
MANIGTLSVSLVAKAGDFMATMKAGVDHVTQFGKKITDTVFSLKGLAVGLAGVGSLEFIKHTAEAISHTGKLADRLGVTVDALQELRDAARLSGMETEAFDEHLEKMNKILGEPSPKVTEALEKIGLNMGGLIALNPAEQFKKIADGINKLGTQNQRAAVAADLFGRSGYEMLNVLDRGKDGLEASAEATRKLRGELSRVEVAKVEAATGGFKRLEMVVEGVHDKVVVLLAPLVSALEERLLGMGKTGKSAADTIVDGMVRMAQSFTKVLDGLNLIISGFQTLKGVALRVQQAYQQEVVGFAIVIDKLLHPLTDLNKDFYREQLEDVAETGKAAADAFTKAATAYKAFKNEEISGAVIRNLSGLQRQGELAAEKVTKEKAEKRAAEQLAAQQDAAKKLGIMFYGATEQAQKFIDRLSAMGTIQKGIDLLKEKWTSLVDRAKAAGWRAAEQIAPEKRTAVGTFSEMGNRLTGAQTIPVKQLEAQHKMVAVLESIDRNLSGGVPLTE